MTPAQWMAGVALAGAAGVAWWQAMTRRNLALVRPPVRDSSGATLRSGTVRYSDGQAADYIDAGPSAVSDAGPSGEALVWVPGADGPKETFRHQLPHFAARHRVVCADLRSEFAPGQDFDRLVDDVAELADDRGLDRFVLIGTSLGSAISLRFASRFPDRLAGLVLCNPLARITYDHVGLNRALLAPVAMVTTRYLPTDLSRRLARRWSRLGVWLFDDSPGRDAIIEYALFTGPRTVRPSVSDRRVAGLRRLDLLTGLSSIAVPALVVKGGRDVYCPVAWAKEIAARLPAADYVPIPDTGHCSHISRPDRFNEILDGWLSRLKTCKPSGGSGMQVAKAGGRERGPAQTGGTEAQAAQADGRQPRPAPTRGFGEHQKSGGGKA